MRVFGLVSALVLLAALACAVNAQATCDAATSCSGNGFCRSDNSCSCDPEFYGSNCSKVISSGSVTDGGLAGIIIGWIIGLPLFLFAVFLGVQTGFFARCFGRCGDMCQGAGRKDDEEPQAGDNRRSGQSTPNRANVQAGPYISRPVDEARDRRYIPGIDPPRETNGSPGPVSPRPDDGLIVADQPSNTNPKGLTPHQQSELIEDVHQVMAGNFSRDRIRVCLQDNQWDQNRAMDVLLGEIA